MSQSNTFFRASAFAPRPSRLGLRASAFAPRPSRLGRLDSQCHELTKAIILLGLALLTFNLLFAPPVLAQGGYPGGGGSGGGYPGSGGSGSPPNGHYWQITYSQAGTWNNAARDSPQVGQSTFQPGTWPVSYQPNGGGYFGGAGRLIDGNMQGVVRAVLTWIPTTGQTLATDPPSEPVYITESASASEAAVWGGSGSAPTGYGTVEDGLGDTPVVNGTGLTASGTYLIARDGSSGIIVLTDLLLAVAPTSTFTPYPPPGYGGGTWDWTACSCAVSFSVSIPTTLPKSIMITSPIRSNQIYNGGQWLGTGDTRFDDYEFVAIPDDPIPPSVGTIFGPLSWDAALLGSPWPVYADYQAGWFSRQWFWNSTPQSATNTTFGIPEFDTDRDHVDWPWDANMNLQSLDPLDAIQRAPAPVQKHIWLHLTDTDDTGAHPEWNFNNTANYYVTEHNEGEDAIITSSTPESTSVNPWIEYLDPNNAAISSEGIAPSLDSQGKPISGTGTYPWVPGQVTVYEENNYDYSLDIPITPYGGGWGGSQGTNNGQGINYNPPQTVIPVGKTGTVYYRLALNHIAYTYRHFSVLGEDIRYNSDGSINPLTGWVDRPPNGLGTYSWEFAVWVEPSGFNFPKTTTVDLTQGN